MIRINLLPYRQEKRRQRQRQMVVLCAMTAGLAALTVMLVYTILNTWIEGQESRNSFLKAENAKLDQQIDEIKRVKEETAALLARKQVVESLQSNRSEAVHILDQLLRVLPEGTYLKSIHQTGTAINLTGYAQSNARVSTLLRNLDDSPWLEGAELVEIRSATVNNVRASEFNVNVKVKRQKPEAPAAAPFRPKDKKS